MNPAVWLCLTIVFTALWSGLLLTVTTILHPMFGHQDNVAMRYDLGRFLPIARRSPTNYLLVIGLIGAPIGALVALADAPSEAPFVLTAVGLALTFTGAGVISRLRAEPNYDVLLTSDPLDPDGPFPAARHRYFALNWVRGAFVWTALACFTSAYLAWG